MLLNVSRAYIPLGPTVDMLLCIKISIKKVVNAIKM